MSKHPFRISGEHLSGVSSDEWIYFESLSE